MILDNDIPKLDTDMIKAGSRYKHSEARELTNVARDKMEKRREITDDLAFREKLRGKDALFDFLALLLV